MFSALASAGVIYGTFGPGDTFFTGEADLVGGGSAIQNEGREWADPFTVSNQWTVTQYRVAARSASGGNSGLLSLWSGTSVPTTLLEANVPFGPMTDTPGIFTIPSRLNPQLAPGETYWVSLSAVDPLGDFYGWQWTSFFDPNLVRYTRLTGGSWEVGGATVGDAFDVQGNQVPEPSTWQLTLVAALIPAMTTKRWRRYWQPVGSRED